MRRTLLRFQLICYGENSGCRQIFFPSDFSEMQRHGLLNYDRDKCKVSFNFDFDYDLLCIQFITFLVRDNNIIGNFFVY